MNKPIKKIYGELIDVFEKVIDSPSILFSTYFMVLIVLLFI
jgi:hypothetical protein